MKHLPIFYDLSVGPCLVVGAGGVATRKVRQLIKREARVTVVAPEICNELKALASSHSIKYIAKPFDAWMLERYILVIVATNVTAVNSQVSHLCKESNIPVNVVDNPGLSSFFMPAIVEREPLQIAISSSGVSPVLVRLLRTKLEALIPSSYGSLAKLVGAFREKIKRRYPEIRDRRRFWERILTGGVAERIYAGEEAALELLEAEIKGGGTESQKGEVYLVGAGPGDPDLLTLRALRLMQQSEVVLYDRLVSPAIIELVRRDAERIYVGKKRDNHSLHQQEINALLVKLARDGKRVLRLKGGDPFIFGRGGEEIETLTSENVLFQVVPGITAASGCASYAGIPLTHRDYANSCVFITGHMRDGKMDMNWDSLIQPKQTIAVYMGVAGLEVLSRELISHGMSGELPAAIIQQGTTAKQRVYISELKGLSDIAEAHKIKPPAMVIIGEVVKLNATLAWFKPDERVGDA